MNIRPARPDEATLIQELIYELALFEKAPESAQASVAQITAAFFATHPAVFCDMIEDDEGAVQGLGIWFLNYSTWTGTHGIYLEDLFIRESARGRGYGKAFLRHLAALCQERGYQRLQWWVLNWNQTAIDFYRDLGAQFMDEWTVMRVDGAALSALSALNQ